jgi:hypothetical protein
VTAKQQLEAFGKLSFRNEDKIQDINWCYYCQRKVLKEDIAEWADSAPNRTAICPHCLVDAILPGDHPKELIKSLYNHWFK